MSCEVETLLNTNILKRNMTINTNNVTSTNTTSNNSSNGTTSSIRKRLNFTDEILWKQFSSRRLQLVESLSLSSKKASEQDEEIKICANTLLNEFDFPKDSLPEFDKLVRLAIQSVRRNKKRSEKRLASKLENFSTSDDEIFSSLKRPKFDETNTNNNFNDNSNSNSNLTFLSNVIVDDDVNENFNDHTTLLNEISNISNNNNSIDKVEKLENHDSRVAINTLISPIIPNDIDKLPSLKRLDKDIEFSKSSLKILHAIKNSKSCFEFSKNSNNDYDRIKNYDLLEEFGSNCITSAILFTLEKWFDHLLPDSSSYIKLRLKSDLTLGLIIKNLDKTSIEVNRLNNYVASQLFKKLIGGCVKDFGFDTILNPLCDIFHNIILTDYPIIAKEQIKIKNNNNKLNNNSNTASTDNNNKNITNNNTNSSYFKEISIIDSTIQQPQQQQSNILSVDLNFSSSGANKNLIHSNSSSNFSALTHSGRGHFTKSNDHPSLKTTTTTNNNTINTEITANMTSTLRSDIPDFPLSTAHIPIPPINDLNMVELSRNVLPSPPVLRSKKYTHVIIKFKEKELKFRFSIDSNAPPTILELITNCRQAFGIINSTRVLNLRDLRANKIIKNDHDLERVLRMSAMLSHDGNGEVILELIFANVTQGYLNLNYDSKNNESDSVNTPPPPPPPHTTENSDIKNKNNIINTDNMKNETISESTSESLISRYLPPPRPVRQDTQPMGGFMKFQPLL